MSMEKTETIEKVVYYIFLGKGKRRLVVAVVVTLLVVLFSYHTLDVSLSKLNPACSSSKLTQAAYSVTKTLIPVGAISKLTRAADGNNSHVMLYDYALEKAFLPPWFFNVSMSELNTMLKVKQRRDVAPNLPYVNVSRNASWAVFRRHIRESCLYDNDDPAVDGLLRDMATLPIVATEAITKGKRLKLSVQFSDGGWAVLKSQQESDKGRREPPDSEIAAFHLDRLLDFYRVPPTVGRRVNIRSELAPTVSHIKEMFINVTQDGRVCFGRTFKVPLQACGEPDTVNVSLQHFLRDAEGYMLISRSNPWGYKLPWGKAVPGMRQRMEKTCMAARASFSSSAEFDSHRRVLDTLDAAYFDMLTDNWDRHSFGYMKEMENTLVLFDNEKGFYNSSKDLVLSDFLYKRGGCCLMKKTTFLKFLKLFLGPQRLSDLMRGSLRADPLAPVLYQSQLLSLDRRLDIIMSFINDCFKEHGVAGVILDDISLV